MCECVTVSREHIRSLERLLVGRGRVTLAQLSEAHILHQQVPCGLAEKRKKDHVVFVIRAVSGQEPVLEMTYKPSGDLGEIHSPLLRRLWSRLQLPQEAEVIGPENGGCVGFDNRQFVVA